MDDGHGMHPMTALPVTIGDVTYQWWSVNHARDLATYVRSLSASLVRYKLDAYEALQGPAQITALRQLQHEASEYLFALLGAYAHDPAALPAWMTLYRNQDVYAFAGTLMRGDRTEYDNLMDGLLNLQAVSVTIDGKVASKVLVVESFYRHLRSIFKEFDDPASRDEYTSTKHSYRVTAGGFKLEMVLGDRNVPVITSETGITYTNQERLNQHSPLFGKKDVVVLTSTSAHFRSHVVTMIRAIIDLTTLVITAIQSRYGTGAPDAAAKCVLPHGRLSLRQGAAAPGNGRFAESFRRFRKVSSGAIEGALTIDVTVLSPRDEGDGTSKLFGGWAKSSEPSIRWNRYRGSSVEAK